MEVLKRVSDKVSSITIVLFRGQGWFRPQSAVWNLEGEIEDARREGGEPLEPRGSEI